MKLRLLVIIAFYVSAFACTPSGNLATNTALEKYSPQLGDQSFLVFPVLREDPIKWFDSIPESKIKDALSRNNL